MCSADYKIINFSLLAFLAINGFKYFYTLTLIGVIFHNDGWVPVGIPSIGRVNLLIRDLHSAMSYHQALEPRETRGPFHEQFFPRNSNLMENRFNCNFIVGYHITTIFCTCDYSMVIMQCAKFHSDHLMWIRAEWNFHKIWITMEKSYVKWAHRIGWTQRHEIQGLLNP